MSRMKQRIARFLNQKFVRHHTQQINRNQLNRQVNQLFAMISRSEMFGGQNKAQLYQDIFVLLALNFKRDGYFVEFGATNGVDLSNTYLLEKAYGWQGILAEPGKVWHEDLARNRAAHIEHACVWRASDEVLSFNMAEQAEFSTIDSFSESDGHARLRETGEVYEVGTISLLDLLAKYDAPREIDYLSIDTEGSELEILSSFDFSRYRFSVITCEHNFGPDRAKIRELLEANGYARRFVNFSRWDDWYLHASLCD